VPVTSAPTSTLLCEKTPPGVPHGAPRHDPVLCDFKTAFLDALLQPFMGRPVRLLDLGSGTSKDFPDLLRRYPNVAYTGVEPNEASRATAARLLDGIPQVMLDGAWGESVAARYRGTFDITLSLSVLEHVKYLDDFLRTSVATTAPGGLVVHRYDLGHALYPVSWYERALVSASRAVPWVVPASVFTTYPDLTHITRTLAACGLYDLSVRYGQMYGLKQAMNQVARTDAALAMRIVQLDRELAEMLAPRQSAREKARLFPTVTVRGVKR
jgi:SAM-dependent methyltransferase